MQSVFRQCLYSGEDFTTLQRHFWAAIFGLTGGSFAAVYIISVNFLIKVVWHDFPLVLLQQTFPLSLSLLLKHVVLHWVHSITGLLPLSPLCAARARVCSWVINPTTSFSTIILASSKWYQFGITFGLRWCYLAAVLVFYDCTSPVHVQCPFFWNPFIPEDISTSPTLCQCSSYGFVSSCVPSFHRFSSLPSAYRMVVRMQ